MKTWNKGTKTCYEGFPKFIYLYWHKSCKFSLIKTKNSENAHWELWRNHLLIPIDKNSSKHIPPTRLVTFSSWVTFNEAKMWFNQSSYNKEV